MPSYIHAKKNNDEGKQANQNGAKTWVHELDPLQCKWCWQFVSVTPWTNKIPVPPENHIRA